MGNRHKAKFNIKFRGKKGKFWRAVIQEYQNCEISAGLIKGLEPDTVYLRLDKDNTKPTTLLLRPDEALAVIYVLSGALWSQHIIEGEKNVSA